MVRSPHVQPGAVARANVVPFAIPTSRFVFYPSWSFKFIMSPSLPIRLHTVAVKLRRMDSLFNLFAKKINNLLLPES